MAQTATIGSISHGTLRTVDLLDAFASELDRLESERDDVAEARAVLTLHNAGWLTIADSGAAGELVQALQDALNDRREAMAEYKPRGMPSRFMDGAPDVVKRNVIDILAIVPAAPLDYDIVFRQHDTPRGGAAYGLDFGAYGEQGCHFYLTNHDMRAYRERNRRKRVAWRDLPEATREAIVAYLESE